MARKIFLKIWSILISSLALLGADSSSQSKTSYAGSVPAIWQLTVKRQSKPELFLQQSTVHDESIVIAAHRSHSSHRSHASHASHVSGVSRQAAPPRSSSSSTDTTESERVTPPAKSSLLPSSSPSSSTNTTGNELVVPPTRTLTPSRSDNKNVFMKNGATIDCDSSWISEGKLFFSKDGKTFSLPIDEIDLEKTSVGSKK
jgi:hypothetical protein